MGYYNDEIQANDTVTHKPTGETFTVCGVDRSAKELVPWGKLFPQVLKIEECELNEKGYLKNGWQKEYLTALQKEGLERFIDVTAAMFIGLI